jgi:pyruvate/2-oxoglutarate/acetoin dehydrogenase E1 component
MVIAESYVEGLVSGMEFLGINPKLVERMRKTFIAKGIDDMRRKLNAP